MVFVLAKRDFLSRVKGTAYILTTVIGILVFVGLSFLPPLMDQLTASFAPKDLELIIYEQADQISLGPYLLEIAANRPDITFRLGADEKVAYREVVEQNLTGLLLIDGPLYTLITQDGSNVTVNGLIENLLNQALARANAERLGISGDDFAALFQRAELRVREIGPQGTDGEELDGTAHTQAMILAYFLLFMIYMALIMYGNMVASGVAEEKSSRIMEVMVSTVKPIELMLGKIIGIGALGLLQFLIWIGTGLAMTALGKSNLIGGFLGMAGPLNSIPLDIVLWFGLYFLLGYFFYASIFAAGGALVSRVEEVNQVVTLIMMLIIVGFFGAYISFVNPNSNFAIAASFIPFTSPMVMFARIVLANPSFIQIILSVVILVASVIGSAWVSARIYRIGILLYGKRPSFKQVLQLIKDWN